MNLVSRSQEIELTVVLESNSYEQQPIQCLSSSQGDYDSRHTSKTLVHPTTPPLRLQH